MPSISDGLFSGRAGIQSHGTAIAVLADNISNSNTTGFKATRADFADLLSGSIGGGSGTGVTVGSGSSVLSTTTIFNQGTFENTGRNLDVAVNGDGFFIVEDSLGSQYYTRAGNFKVDADGNLLNQNGYSVMGFPTGGAGGLDSLNVNTVNTNDISTSNVGVTGNLDAGATIIAPPATRSATNGAATTTFSELATISGESQFSTFVDVFDSLGGSHTVTSFYFKTGSNSYTVRSYVDGADIDQATSPNAVDGLPYQIQGTVLQFNNDGTLLSATPEAGYANPVTIDWAGGADDGSINFDFTGFTQFSIPSSPSSISQDGSGGGQVVSFNIGEDGTVFAQLNNGQTTTIGRLALARFSNPEGLSRTSGSLYRETITSGEPVVGIPSTGQFGSLAPQSLELSTADLASDFIKLISLQRGFQGSSRIIGNIDELLNEVVNLL